MQILTKFCYFACIQLKKMFKCCRECELLFFFTCILRLCTTSFSSCYCGKCQPRLAWYFFCLLIFLWSCALYETLKKWKRIFNMFPFFGTDFLIFRFLFIWRKTLRSTSIALKKMLSLSTKVRVFEFKTPLLLVKIFCVRPLHCNNLYQ